jgi:hypothetical protein
MLKPAVSLAAAGCEVVVNPFGSGPAAGLLIASMICSVEAGSVADDDPDADPDAEPVPVVWPCGEPEWSWCRSTTVAAPAAAPMIASATTAAFQPSPDRPRRGGAYSAPDQAGEP